MIINTLPPQIPTLNSDVIRPQVSPDSSPESTVIQNQKVAPLPDARVVQQGNETASNNSVENPKQEESADGQAGRDGQQERDPRDPAGEELLTDEERREVEVLAQRDREVRAHEQAHLSAAGNRALGGVSFSYTVGPDGKRYATGGEVSIDTSPVAGDPEATLRAAELIRRAALAPAEPSAQDRQVAAEANAMAQVARVELTQQRIEEVQQSRVSDAAHASSEEGASSQIANDPRDELTKSRQQQLEGIVSAVENGAVDEPRGVQLDYYL